MTTNFKAFTKNSLIALCMGWGVMAHAGIFDDDEARKAIIDLRQKVEVLKGNFETLQANQNAFQEESVQLKKSILNLQSMIEGLKQEIQVLSGDKEVLTKALSETQRQLKTQAQILEDRMARIEPQKVSLDGQEFTAEQNEIRDFENALSLFKKADYPSAANAFADFNKRYPSSGYAASSIYFMGTAQYANRDYKTAVNSFKNLISIAPVHLRVPDAKLSIASCLIELKDTKGARKTLEDLIKDYPQSEAAQSAKERILKLK
jgi:tol-pal system protein YbgF